MPFRHVSRVLEELLGVYVSSETARRLCEEVGQHVEEKQTAEAKAPWEEDLSVPEDEHRLAMSADGAMVPLVGGEWAEVRTLAIGEVPAKASPPENVPVKDLSSFSRLTDAASFTDLAEVETRRRRVVQASSVCAVMDGADWLQSFVEIHRADAVRLLDFPHAAEHVSKLLEALEAFGMTFPARMLERCFHVLKHRGPAALLRMADRFPDAHGAREEVREHLGYCRKRLDQMHDPTSRRAGWPIGSGMGERANTLVVEARLKGAGMRWGRAPVNPMLAFRNAVWNDRWLETWQMASKQRLTVRKERHHHLIHLRRQAKAVPSDTLLPDVVIPFPSSPPTPLLPPDPPAMIAGTSRPSRHHPWTRMRACAPKELAKT
jgi:hypothetical protein